MSKPVIVPDADVMSHRTGTVRGLTKQDIDRILGFEPNVDDDEFKVKYSWGFTVNGVKCAVWDWKGSYTVNQFSAFGPDNVLREVFSNCYKPFEISNSNSW
jgi:hypothetical protein